MKAFIEIYGSFDQFEKINIGALEKKIKLSAAQSLDISAGEIDVFCGRNMMSMEKIVIFAYECSESLKVMQVMQKSRRNDLATSLSGVVRSFLSALPITCLVVPFNPKSGFCELGGNTG